MLAIKGLYNAEMVRKQMGEPFAPVGFPAESEPAPAPQFVAL